jgi:CzcA family heavy metal efflux pump
LSLVKKAAVIHGEKDVGNKGLIEMKKLLELVIRNRIAVIFVTLVLLAISIFTLFTLPQGVFPKATFPRVQVKVDRGYAPLDEMEVGVTKPLEDALRTVEGARIVRSKTARGNAEIDIYFDWNTDLNQVYQTVLAKVSEVRAALPQDVSITITRMTTSAYPMSGYSIYSDKRALKELRDIAEFTIKPQLSGIKGVYKVEIVGGERPEYWAILKPEKLAQFKISPLEIEEAIKKSNHIDFLGRITEEYKIHLGFANYLLKSKKDIENVIISQNKGVPVLLKQVAEVKSAVKEEYLLTTSNWHPAVLFNILKHPDANVVEVSNLVDKRLVEIENILPPDVKISKWYDLSKFVKRSIKGVAENILIGILIISVIVFLFLGKVRTSLPIVLIMPLTVITTFLLIKLFGLSLNIMTLGGLTAAIGILVANAIVVVENIVRHRDEGASKEDAVISGTKEIIPPLIGATLTTIVVFIPLIFLSGLTGIFFKPAAFTMASAVGISLILAIFVTPVVTYNILGKKNKNISVKHSSEKLRAFYRKILRISLRRSGLILILSLITGVLSVFLYPYLKTGFLPSWDEGTAVFNYKAVPGTSLKETDRICRRIEEILKGIPEVESYSRRTGYGLAHRHPAHEGDYLISLRDERKRSTSEIMEGLSKEVEKIFPSLYTDWAQVLPDRLMDLTGEQKTIAVKVFGNNKEILRDTAIIIKDKLKRIKGLVGIKAGVSQSEPEFDINFNNSRVARLGFSLFDVSKQVKIALWGDVVIEIKKGLRLIGLRVRYPKNYRSYIDKLKNLPLFTKDGKMTPLSTIADVEVKGGARNIYHENGSLLVTVTAGIAGRDLGSVVKDIKSTLANLHLPQGVTITLGGDWESRLKSFRELLLALIIAGFLIFTILLFEFESYRAVFAIFLGTILSFSFVVFGLFITKTAFDVSSFMGMIASLGIVVNNGILLIDFAERYKKKGVTLAECVVMAGRVRLRPILITTTTTVAGFLPMAIQIGAGGEMLQPFAVAVISGLLGSIFFSLIAIPTLFYLFERKEMGN